MQQLTGIYGFLGYGNMGGAILAGLLDREMLTPDQIRVYDPDGERTDQASALGVGVAPTPAALARECDVLVLAIKPQTLDEALAPVLPAASPDIRVISIMAGISIAALETRFGDQARIVRVMPNTPALVGAGAAALAHNRRCLSEDIAAARAIFEAVGIVELVPESCLDAVTALSGSGPAYFFYLTECLAAAGVAEGLPEKTAGRLAAQTLLGAGQLLVASGKAPDVLREQVTSKGGTTFAALETLRAHNFSDIISAASRAATERSRALGKQNE